MRLTIKSRRFKKEVTFYCEGGEFDPHSFHDWRQIHVDLNSPQLERICEGGFLTVGPGIVVYSKEDFYRTSRAWWRKYLRNTKES